MSGFQFPFLVPELPEPEQWLPDYMTSHRAGTYSNFGPLSLRLERETAREFAVDGYSAVACSSATVGLAVALSVRFREGSRIAVPNFTFAATYQATLMAGMVPVLVDVSEDTLEICCRSLVAADAAEPIDGVLSVRPLGMIRSQAALLSLCEERGWPLVIDAAACLANWRGFGSASGHIEVFSLHATKSFGIGEGGLIFCPDIDAGEIRRRINFAFEADRRFHPGFNGKMDELHAAVGLAQLSRIARIQTSRAAMVARYRTLFSGRADFQLFANPEEGSGWTMFPVLLAQGDAGPWIDRFAEHGVECRRYYWPTLAVGDLANKALRPVPLNASEELARRIICFPVYGPRAADLIQPILAVAESVLEHTRAANLTEVHKLTA